MDYLAISKILGEIAVSLQAILALIGTPADIPLGGVPLEPVSIEQKLVGKNSNEKSLIKSQEIEKLNYKGVFSKDGIKVEIVNPPKQITSDGKDGIELFAKAWKNGKQLGFGKDGSVEVERFRFFNPRILVDDVNGNIVRTSQNEFTKEIKQRKLREDPKQALKESLIETIKVAGIEGANIVKGKIGNTTTTCYPEAGTGVTSTDGRSNENHTASSFATLMSDPGDEAYNNEALSYGTYLGANIADSLYNLAIRGFFFFDCSAIPDTDTTDSATFSLVVGAKVDQLGGLAIALTSASSTATTSIATTDYGLTASNTLRYATDILISNINADGSTYNNWTLNTDGKNHIDKTNVTKFGTRINKDIDNVAPTWGSNEAAGIQVYWADEAGTTKDPKLVVVHSGAGGGGDLGGAIEQQMLFFE